MYQDQSNALWLHPGQYEVFNTRSRFKVVAAGRRWGKTRLSLTSIIKAARIRKRLIWYVAPSYRMAKNIMWYELLSSIPRSWIKKINETTMTIRLINQTVIELKGADKPDSLRGVGIHYLVLDEFQDMRPETWTQVLRPTLADTGGHALFIGTSKSYNHFYDLWSYGQRPEFRNTGEWYSWQYKTIDSPFIPDKEVEMARRDMDEKSFRQEFEASFENMSGRVYYSFNRREHLGEYKFNKNLPIWIGQDFNIDPMASIILQPQLNGEVWAIDEMVLNSSNTEEVANELERRYWRFMKTTTIYPDPAGGQRQHARGETDLDILRQKGFNRMKIRRRAPSVADRVNSVNKMLKTASGEIRFRIDTRCRALTESLEQTIYKPESREVDKSMNIEHITDALGYCFEIQFPVKKIWVGGRSL